MQGSMVIIVKGYYQPIANPQHFLRHIARHHDPDQLSIGEVRRLAQRAGFDRLIVDEVTLNKLPTLWQKKSASTKPLGT